MTVPPSDGANMSGLDFLNFHPFVRAATADKARGVILGGALGDALGLYTEFLPSSAAHSSYPNGIEVGSTPFRGDSHRDKFTLGLWTDDTDHSLLLLLSFLHYYGEHQKAPDASTLANDFAARLTSWCSQGLLCLSRPPLGLGQTIATVALNPNFLKDPHALAREKWLKVTLGEKPASNGSLMRTHPVGVMAVCCKTDEDAFALAAEISTSTHADPRCTLACCAVVGVLRGILRGEILNEDDLDRALEKAITWIKTQPRLCDPGNESATVGSFDWLKLDEFDRHSNGEATLSSLELDDSRKMGYIYKCFGSAIVTLRAAMREPSISAKTFRSHMTALIMAGGDADTNGSVAGALLGAWVGAARLPSTWIDGLVDHDWLLEKTTRFVAATGIRDREGDAAWTTKPKDTDTDINGGTRPLTKEEIDERERSMVFAVVAKSKQRDEAERAKKTASKKWYQLS